MAKIKKTKIKNVNLPDAKLHRTPHTKREIEKAAKERVSRISKELTKGFDFIKKYPRSVTIFGSARLKHCDPYYKKAMSLANKLSKAGFAVATGGGPGIMEAANKGAYDRGGSSLGFNIKLPMEQVLNSFVTESVSFYYFFVRKVALSFSAEAYIFFPGGYGTLDEFFEIMTLVQTNKITKVPIILVGKDFWEPIDKFIKNSLAKKYQTIDKKDCKLYKIVDDENEILKIVKKAPLRKE